MQVRIANNGTYRIEVYTESNSYRLSTIDVGSSLSYDNPGHLVVMQNSRVAYSALPLSGEIRVYDTTTSITNKNGQTYEYTHHKTTDEGVKIINRSGYTLVVKSMPGELPAVEVSLDTDETYTLGISRRKLQLSVVTGYSYEYKPLSVVNISTPSNVIVNSKGGVLDVNVYHEVVPSDQAYDTSEFVRSELVRTDAGIPVEVEGAVTVDEPNETPKRSIWYYIGIVAIVTVLLAVVYLVFMLAYTPPLDGLYYDDDGGVKSAWLHPLEIGDS